MTTNITSLPLIAAVQMCSSHIVEENLATAEVQIEEAAKNNAKLIVLPEMFSIMGMSPSDKVKVKEKFGYGKVQSFLSEQAKKHHVWIVGGTIPIECNDNNKVRAASIVYNDQGETVGRYDKIHLFDVQLSETEIYRESDTTEPGNEIVIVNSPFGKIGLAVCYDIRFPELFRVLFNNGVNIICIPSAFTTKTGEAHWETLLKSRAIENFSYVIGSAQGGKHSSGRSTYGNSLIVDPWGTIISRADDNTPQNIYAAFDTKKINDARKSIPVSNHQKIFFDIASLKLNTLD